MARGAVRARAAVRRLHGRRPHPPPLLDRVGGGRAREPRGRGLPDPRRGGGRARRPRRRRQRHRRLRPRRRPPARGRQPQRLAGRGGLPHVRDRRRRGRRASSWATALELRRYLPERLRYSAKQRLPGLRERAIERSDYTVLDWERDAGVLVRDLRQHRPQRPRSRGARHRRARRGVRARARRRSRHACSSCEGPNGERIVARPTAARISSTAPSWPRFPTSSSSSTTTPGSARATSRPGRTRSGTRSRSRAAATTPTSAAIGTRGSSCSPARPSRQGAPVSGRARRRRPDAALPLGEAVPADLEGRILVEALRPELLDARPPDYDDAAPDRVRARAGRARGGGRRRGRAPPARARLPRVARLQFQEILTGAVFPCNGDETERRRSVSRSAAPEADRDPSGTPC